MCRFRTLAAPPPSRPTFLSDHTSASGLLGTIAQCDVRQATTSARPGGPTVAAHVHHVAFSLTVARARMTGDSPSVDWEGSWRVGPLDSGAWDALRERLAEEHRQTLAVIAALSSDQFDEAKSPGAARRDDQRDALQRLRTATWALGHAAYHLGAVRAAWRAIADDARMDESLA